MNILRFLDRVIEQLSIAILIINVFLMLLLSLLGIILRWLGTSLLWIDPLTRHLVLASAFLGGILATGYKNHIAVDILPHLLKTSKRHRLNKYLFRFVSLTTSIILVWFTLSSWRLVQIEMEYGKSAFWNIPSGYLVAIIPCGLGLICYRFFFIFIDSFGENDRGNR